MYTYDITKSAECFTGGRKSSIQMRGWHRVATPCCHPMFADNCVGLTTNGEDLQTLINVSKQLN